MRLLLSSILFVTLMVSCGKPDTPVSDKTAQNQNILRFDVNAPLTSLNPKEVYASGSTVIFPLLYSYLFVPNGEGKLEPDLALKWTYDPETLTYTIHLRRDALFHNQQPVTARDVEYSLGIALKDLRPYLSASIHRLFPLSDTVICMRLEKDDPGFLQKIWDMEIVPTPSETKIELHNHPIGSGPFRFKYRRGDQEVALEPNENYFHGRPSLDEVVFYFQPDKEEAWARLLAGETDIAQEMSPKNYEMTRQYEKRYYFDLYPLQWYAILLYNTKNPLFSEPNVRLALSYAIDKEYIVEGILNGLGVVAVGPMGVDSPYHNPEVKPVPYDPQKGLKLLKQAGWSYQEASGCLTKEGTGFEFNLLVAEESQIEKRVARYLQLCLNDLGIKVHLESIPFLELSRRYIGNDAFQAVLTEFSGVYRDPEFMRSGWSSSPSERSEAGGFDHPEVNRLIRQALDETDPSKQKELFYEIDALIVSLQPGTFLFHKTAIDAMSKRFKLPFPFSLTHEGVWRLRYASLR